MTINRHLERLDALERKVAALEKSDTTNDLRIEIEQLQEHIAETTTREVDTTPIWTERVAIDSTVKDGYRVKESTVTVQNAGGDEQTREERRRRIAEAIEDGQMVANDMNRLRTTTITN